jgi:hypothetical protein
MPLKTPESSSNSSAVAPRTAKHSQNTPPHPIAVIVPHKSQGCNGSGWPATIPTYGPASIKTPLFSCKSRGL